MLDPLTVNVIEAGSGERGAQAAAADDFAVILLDVQMPDMDGFETAELIKRRSKTQDIPIIFLTAIDKEQQKVFRGYSVGAVDYMFKPFDPEVLRSKVSVFVDLYEKSQRLQESEERFRAAFANAPIGIGLIDTDGCWLQVNKALCDDRRAAAQSDLVGEAFDSVLVPERPRRRRGPTWTRCSRASARPTRPSASTCTRTGFPVDVLVSVSLARDADGRAAQLRRAGARHDRAQARPSASGPSGSRSRPRAPRPRPSPRRSSSLQRITDVALRHLSLDDLLRGLLAEISDILEVEGAAIGLLDSTGNTLVIEATYGYAQTVERGFRVALGEGFTGRIAATGKPAVIATAAGVEPLEPFLRQAGIGVAAGRAAAQRRPHDRRPARRHPALARVLRTRTRRCSSWPPTAPRWRSSTPAPTSASAASSRRSSAR